MLLTYVTHISSQPNQMGKKPGPTLKWCILFSLSLAIDNLLTDFVFTRLRQFSSIDKIDKKYYIQKTRNVQAHVINRQSLLLKRHFTLCHESKNMFIHNYQSQGYFLYQLMIKQINIMSRVNPLSLNDKTKRQKKYIF